MHKHYIHGLSTRSVAITASAHSPDRACSIQEQMSQWRISQQTIQRTDDTGGHAPNNTTLTREDASLSHCNQWAASSAVLAVDRSESGRVLLNKASLLPVKLLYALKTWCTLWMRWTSTKFFRGMMLNPAVKYRVTANYWCTRKTAFLLQLKYWIMIPAAVFYVQILNRRPGYLHLT